LSLVVVEVGWDRDNGLGDLLAEFDFGNFLHLDGISAAEEKT
jgi:hypothetical protein